MRRVCFILYVFLAPLYTLAFAEEVTLVAILERVFRDNHQIQLQRARYREARAFSRGERAQRGLELDLSDSSTQTSRSGATGNTLNQTVKYNLYNGGEREGRITQAEALEREAWWRLRETIQNQLELAGIAYLDYLQGGKQVAVHREAVDTETRRIVEISAKVRAGILLESELLNGRLHLLTAERLLLVARTHQKLAVQNLAIYASVGVGDELLPNGEIWPLSELSPPSFQERQIPVTNPAVAVQRERERRSAGLLREKRGEQSPTIDVEWRSNQILQGRANSGEKNFWDFNTQVRWNLFDSGRRGAAIETALHGRDAQRLETVVEIENQRIRLGELLLELEEAHLRLESARVSVTLGREQQALLQKRFLAGQAVKSELLDADASYREAQLEEVESDFKIMKNLLKILKIRGQLLEILLPNQALNPLLERENDGAE